MNSNSTEKGKFSLNTTSLKESAIGVILRAASDPEMISFGGGLPNPDSFPLGEVQEILNDQFKIIGKKMLQYGPTEGVEKLRVELSKRLNEKEGIDCSPSNIIQTTGSQQGLYTLGRVFADPGDYVITEAPTYVDAIVSFRTLGIRMVGVGMDSEGMKMDSLRETLKKYPHPRFIYAIPTFQNPSGITMSLERRKELLEIAREKDIPVLEDDPYGGLRFSGTRVASLKSLDRDGNVIYLGTFSKILSPGIRLGYMVGSEDVIHKATLEKEAIDLGSSTLSQFIAAEYLSKGYMERHLPKIIELYRHKRDLMLESFEKNFSKEVEYTRPEGGMFIWITKKGIDTDKMLPLAIQRKVIYVAGSAFYPDGDNHESMRLNFTYSSDERIVEGVKRIASLLKG